MSIWLSGQHRPAGPRYACEAYVRHFALRGCQLEVSRASAERKTAFALPRRVQVRYSSGDRNDLQYSYGRPRHACEARARRVSCFEEPIARVSSRNMTIRGYKNTSETYMEAQ